MRKTPSRPPALLIFGDLFVAARQGQLFEEARRRGLASVLVVTQDTEGALLDRFREDPENPLSNIQEVIEVPDVHPDKVLPGVQDALLRFDVQGVLNIGEYFVEATGILASCLGVPGPGSKASRVCRNKLLQRYTIPDLAPKWRVVTPDRRTEFDAASLRFPVVVKPIARNYSKGVQKISDAAALTSALIEYPYGETVLVEELAVGPEFSVEAITQAGRVLWTGVTAKQSNERRTVYFTELEHTSPANLPDDMQKELEEANTHALQQLDFCDGITHAEYRLTSEGPVLMEIAARRPGDEITLLWELSTSKPMEPVMVDLALGVSTTYPQPTRRARHYYLNHGHGQLIDVKSVDVPVYWVVEDYRWPDVSSVSSDFPGRHCAALVHRQHGDILGELRDSSQRSVSVIVDAPLTTDIETVTSRCANTVHIEIQS